MSCVYAIRYRGDGRIYYVGQTRGCPHSRFDDHKKGRTAISRAIKLIGPDDFDMLIVEQVPEDKLNQAELYWIERFGTKYPCGLNEREGGRAGRHSEATRQRMSEARKKVWADSEFREKTMAALKASWAGNEERRKFMSEDTARRMTAEVRANISAKNRERVRSEETRRKLAEANIGKQRSERAKALTSETLRKRWQDPVHRENWLRGRANRQEA